MSDKPTVFEITLAWKENGVIQSNPNPILMDFCPRVGDVINLDGYYQEVISVEYKSTQSIWPTVYVNVIGDANAHETWVASKLSESNPKFFWV
ncbi:hypothetical protein [Photobacterium galatheae]|uniref:Uncharacterized protein n=1 Tax=Photobacterium galatheae TaxID=1654360 RepID=A0A066RSZ2_9GAMM|nr:hypothetical protein [Photobacterium galatheae]KDM90513.1 hypothetical protein EA58_16435 [Photobacterium galatheae]MCM0148033.1 hypothetical protein [Photobacterium galatheae]